MNKITPIIEITLLAVLLIGFVFVLSSNFQGEIGTELTAQVGGRISRSLAGTKGKSVECYELIPCGDREPCECCPSGVAPDVVTVAFSNINCPSELSDLGCCEINDQGPYTMNYSGSCGWDAEPGSDIFVFGCVTYDPPPYWWLSVNCQAYANYYRDEINTGNFDCKLGGSSTNELVTYGGLATITSKYEGGFNVKDTTGVLADLGEDKVIFAETEGYEEGGCFMFQPVTCQGDEPEVELIYSCDKCARCQENNCCEDKDKDGYYSCPEGADPPPVALGKDCDDDTSDDPSGCPARKEDCTPEKSDCAICRYPHLDSVFLRIDVDKIKTYFPKEYIDETRTRRDHTPKLPPDPFSDFNIKVLVKKCGDPYKNGLSFKTELITGAGKNITLLTEIPKLKFLREEKNYDIYVWEIDGWPNGINSQRRAPGEEADTPLDVLVKYQKMWLTIKKDFKSDPLVKQIPIDMCIHLSGSDNDISVVTLRDVDTHYYFDPHRLIGEAEVNRTQGFKEVYPFKNHSFSQYVDLREHYSLSSPPSNSCKANSRFNVYFTERGVTNIYSGKAPVGGRILFIGPGAKPLVVMHEAFHNLGLDDEYVYKAGAFPTGHNNCKDDSVQFSTYGEGNLLGCTDTLGYRSTPNSIMRNPIFEPRPNSVTGGYGDIALSEGLDIRSLPRDLRSLIPKLLAYFDRAMAAPDSDVVKPGAYECRTSSDCSIDGTIDNADYSFCRACDGGGCKNANRGFLCKLLSYVRGRGVNNYGKCNNGLCEVEEGACDQNEDCFIYGDLECNFCEVTSGSVTGKSCISYLDTFCEKDNKYGRCSIEDYRVNCVVQPNICDPAKPFCPNLDDSFGNCRTCGPPVDRGAGTCTDVPFASQEECNRYDYIYSAEGGLWGIRNLHGFCRNGVCDAVKGRCMLDGDCDPSDPIPNLELGISPNGCMKCDNIGPDGHGTCGYKPEGDFCTIGEGRYGRCGGSELKGYCIYDPAMCAYDSECSRDGSACGICNRLYGACTGYEPAGTECFVGESSDKIFGGCTGDGRCNIKPFWECLGRDFGCDPGERCDSTHKCVPAT